MELIKDVTAGYMMSLPEDHPGKDTELTDGWCEIGPEAEAHWIASTIFISSSSKLDFQNFSSEAFWVSNDKTRLSSLEVNFSF